MLDEEYQRLRGLLRWVDWTERAARAFGEHKARLEAKGQIIEDMDIAIGAVAHSLGARLATRNIRHMRRLEGLVVEDWSALR